MLSLASQTLDPHSSMSAAEFGAEDLLRPLRQVRPCLERREEGQVPALAAVLRHPVAAPLAL
jgi:hypothetical protein